MKQNDKFELIDFNLEELKDDEKLEDDTNLTPEEKKYAKMSEALSWLLTFLVAILLSLLLKKIVFINATIPTGSMENTIQKNDDMLGLRLAYLSKEPQRGDIIIFYFPDNHEETFIKRVIGLPGDKVVIKDAKIYINDATEPLDEPYLKEEWTIANDGFEFQVPEDSYLVLGDNRNNSKDARYWRNTYVSKDEIIAKAWLRYAPFSRFGKVE